MRARLCIDLTAPILWPAPTDDLFAADEAGWTTADVRGTFGHHATVYEIGYRPAAELLAKHVLDVGFDHDFRWLPEMCLVAMGRPAASLADQFGEAMPGRVVACWDRPNEVHRPLVDLQ